MGGAEGVVAPDTSGLRGAGTLTLHAVGYAGVRAPQAFRMVPAGHGKCPHGNACHHAMLTSTGACGGGVLDRREAVREQHSVAESSGEQQLQWCD